jgi:hypothetical protein
MERNGEFVLKCVELEMFLDHLSGHFRSES